MPLAAHAINHGTPRKDNYNGFVGMFNFGLSLFLLVCGGFFP